MLDVINEKEGLTSLDEIAKILYMDKHYLSHPFKAKTGVTLCAYLSNKVYEKKLQIDQQHGIFYGENIGHVQIFLCGVLCTIFQKQKRCRAVEIQK